MTYRPKDTREAILLKTCVVDHIKNGETDASITEIMNVFKKNK